jgi:hypothetical protein
VAPALQLFPAHTIADAVPLNGVIDTTAVRAMLTSHEPVGREVGISHSEVEKTAQMSLSARIPSSRDVSATVNRGVLIVQDDPRHPVSLAIRRFADADVAAVEASRNGGAAKPAAPCPI